jgi:hypothetical protein
MRYEPLFRIGTLIVLANMASGCDRLEVVEPSPVADGAPTDEELRNIDYMSAATLGPNGRKLYGRYEEARTCADFELAMRWNRPPNIEGGPFHRKIVYLTSGIPADLPKNSEVFITAKINRGETLPTGSAGWSLRMEDGTLVQAIETANFWEKEEQASQEGGAVAIVKPEKPGRTLCAHGVYEGLVGRTADHDQRIPLVSILFAMDREQ